MSVYSREILPVNLALYQPNLYCVDIMPLQLHFEQVAPGRAFHAALVTQSGGRTIHTHDFWEMMYVLEGTGVHQINGQSLSLHVGELLLIRPEDCHAIPPLSDKILHFINIAFPAELWRAFCAVAGLDELPEWRAAPLPPTVLTLGLQREACARAFHRALHAFTKTPTQLDLCHFWSSVLPLLRPQMSDNVSVPPWLARARAAMEHEENMRVGLPRLLALSGMSPAHLSRTFKLWYGQTPTEFVNTQRLNRAASLLLTSTSEIIDIAYECGFSNLSYFYRLFARHYGQTPRAFRLEARDDVVP